MAAMDLLTRWSGAQPGGPGRPFVTYYDLATGERTELSGTTTANWVAKTGNLLVDELDAEPGVRVHVALPTHWLRTVWLLATWAVGGTVVDDRAEVFVAGPGDLDRASDARHRVASALHPFATPFPAPPTGHLDLGVVLAGQPDAFVPFDEPTPETPAVEVTGLALTHAELETAVAPSSGRILLTPDSLARDASTVLGAMLGGGSLVLVSNATPADLQRLAEQEQAALE